MRTGTLVFRNLAFFRRTNLAVVAGVAIAVAVLTGALLVGQSVRESLRSLIYERIGSTEYVISSNNFFGENLADAIGTSLQRCPIIYLKGVLTHEGTQFRAHNVNVYGVDERFWKFHQLPDQSSTDDFSASIGEALAKQLSVRQGDEMLLRVETQQAIPKEWLYGRRDTVGRTIRLRCGNILPADRLGEFALRPSQGNVFSIFVPMKRLQKDLALATRANMILLSRLHGNKPAPAPPDDPISIRQNLKRGCTLADLGLKTRPIPTGSGFSLETDKIILDDSAAQSAIAAAVSSGMQYAPIYTYLANSIRVNGREIPYSVITAAQSGPLTFGSQPLASNESIWLTDWASKDLGASIGDPVEVFYYLWLESGQLVTRSAEFRLAGTVPTRSIDASFAPEIPGITEANSISAWDPPFPLDLNRIRQKDEDYWNRYRATPKAFITLQKGEQLWGNRFGELTAVRIGLPPGENPESGLKRFSAALLSRLDPEQAGFSITDLKHQELAASKGSTDFGEYFVYFSSFLIAAALLLSALFFKLMVEQRVHEIGILRAAGFAIPALRRIFLIEGISLSVAGSILGLLGSTAYGWLMIFGLRTFWIGAVGTRRLSFHISWPDLLIGTAAGVFFSLFSMFWTLRSLGRNSPRMLLGGILESTDRKRRRARTLAITAVITLVLAALLLIASQFEKVPGLEGFFGSGFLLLVSILCWTAIYLRRRNAAPIYGTGWPAFIRFGIRNASHRPGRSLVCAALIASATFIVISMEAFRQDPKGITLEPGSGTGGYPLVAESAIPIIHDPNTEEGREAIGTAGMQSEYYGEIRFVPFRERPGDDASCLNLYAPQDVRVLGAPHSFVAGGRFSFQKSLAQTEAEQKNPWLLLESSAEQPVIPAVGDANTIQYILHLSLGDELTVRGDNGKPVRLRLVGALRDSIFQGELLISESAFLHNFPEHQGYRFFLIDLPPDQASRLKKSLQEDLSDWGMVIDSTRERLAAYHRVENTYLSTFQSLGALGLFLGTAGLGTILLRNVLERRKELALLRAAGYPRRTLSGIIISENVVLLVWGLAAGSLCAFLAIIPALQARGAAFPFAIAGLIVLSVFLAGIFASAGAVVAALRSPLIEALHSE